MYFLHINSNKDVNKIDKLIKAGKDVFILVYMDGCGPCNATRPEWNKIESALKSQYARNHKLVVVDVNKNFLSSIKHLGEIEGFPTLKYIGNNGKIIETYENSSVNNKDRSVSSFINWIETKMDNTISITPTTSAKHVYNRLKTKKNIRRRRRHKKTRRKVRGHKI